MPAPRRTQKQIAERYKSNLGYYNKLHPWRRARALVSFIAIVGGIIGLIVFQMRGRQVFFNAGKISAPHASIADNCAKCHDQTRMTGGPLTPSKFKQVLSDRFRHGVAFEPIDRKCETCHAEHTFHEPNVVQNRSCSACHQEHRGLQSLTLVASSQCASCHNNAAIMAASAQEGAQLHWTILDRHPQPAQRVAFNLPRPASGYTQTFPSFWNGHPEFQLNVEKVTEPAKVRDPDVLRFNHQRHFASDIPLVNGRKLDCNYCHTPQADGRYMQRISFAANCQACHSLQFDPKNPELTLPHGNATAVRGFLRSLPTQYADLAVRKGITGPKQIQSFVTKQIAQLRERIRSGEELERQVFFATSPYQPQRDGVPVVRASFYGCAFCHEVKPIANAAPMITKPILIDRWMAQARFDHAQHASVKCDDCHHAGQSRQTSDILMPVKANCVTCHSPKGKAAAECMTCHQYHAPSEVAAHFRSAAQSSLRQMLLGAR
jgi:hypothetical protein